MIKHAIGKQTKLHIMSNKVNIFLIPIPVNVKFLFLLQDYFNKTFKVEFCTSFIYLRVLILMIVFPNSV